MNKTMNVLGVIVAWLLSIVLVLMLIITPIIFSALSLLNTDTITKVFVNTLTSGADSDPSAENAQIVTLSTTTQANPAEDIGKDLLAGLFGDSISQEQANAILSSNAVKELLEAYTDDLINAITDDGQEASFNADKIKSIVNDNIDEVVQVLQTNVPELADVDAEELKSTIQKAVDEGAEEIVNALPKPEEIKEQLVQDNPALETAMDILAMKDIIKLAVIGVIVLLSGLIFACRIPGLRGFRWLAVDLFVGGGINALITAGLLISKSAADDLAGETGAQVASLVSTLLSAFTTGMLIRTLVMLVAGGIMLTAYIMLKNLRANKLAETEQTAEIPV